MLDKLNNSQLKQFDTLAAMLIDANKSTNLTRITLPEQIKTRHFEDSLIITPMLKNLQDQFKNKIPTLIDLGSGAGFPVIPLAIAMPNWNFTSVEATRKKTDFQNRVKNQLNLDNLTIINARAENIAHDQNYRENFHAAAARALGSLALIAELAIPLLKINGQMFALKGTKVTNQIQKANCILKKLAASTVSITPYQLPGSKYQYKIASAIKLSKTPKKYPRNFSVIKTSS